MTDSSSNGHPDGVPGEGAGSTDVIRAAARRALEALVLVAEQPLTTHLLGQLLELSPIVVDTLCRELAAEYEEQGRGFQLVEVAGGWRYQSHPDQAPYVERLVLEGQTAKLSAAALETLAIVAYKQPLSRAQVAAIRGVSVDGVMRTLQQRGYIAEIGKDPGPGQAVLFGTTPTFLEKLGLNDLDELPPLGDFVPGADVVEQLERGLRPDREPWRPEDALPPAEGDADESDPFEDLDADMGADGDLGAASGLDGSPGLGADVDFGAVSGHGVDTDLDTGPDPGLDGDPDLDSGPGSDPAADPDSGPGSDPAADPDGVAGLDPDEG